ncbi:cupin domain-containing protein [Sphingomonas sp. SRS2]|uniref:cupin domain-containing protein n=1 Tax=Sphingomonas sp. SRS2 TaxID=133190 RepID=UPI000AE4A01C|nr:cupin domain-containing protein [Sphingomonas sp. SRS2]
MAFEIRRVITGHDEHGNAIVRNDEIMKSQERLPGYQAMTVWCTGELPVNNDETAFNNGEPGAKGQRVLMRIGEMAPDAHSASVMHRTETLDYAVMLAGECDMELDNGEMIRGLKTGDVVIQRGTNHKWIVRGTAPVRFLFVLIDANPVSAGGKLLGDDLGNLHGKISPMPTSA